MATVLSVGLHALVVLIILMLARKTVVAEAPVEVDITFFSAPPPPPPPPPPASTTTKKKKKKKKKKIEKKPDPIPTELVQPTEIPEELPEEEEPEAEEDEEEDEEVADAGVVGGVEGGVKGGVVGGVVGGVKGGVLGGSLDWNGGKNTKGRCRDLGMPRYPEMAKNMGIEGNVLIRVAIDEKGKIMKAKDERCSLYAKADRATRRKSWHPRLCMKAVSGPEELYFDTLMHYAALRCAPWIDQGKPIPMLFKLNVNYTLKNQ